MQPLMRPISRTADTLSSLRNSLLTSSQSGPDFSSALSALSDRQRVQADQPLVSLQSNMKGRNLLNQMIQVEAGDPGQIVLPSVASMLRSSVVNEAHVKRLNDKKSSGK